MNLLPQSKAIQEIGKTKTIKFIFYVLVEVLYHNLIDHILFFPQIRKLFLQILGARIGTDSIIMSVKLINWHHFGPEGLKIGNKCFLADEAMLDLYDSIILEDQVTLGQRVIILTHVNVGYLDHPLQKYFPKKSQGVTVASGSFIGAGSIILPGVKIGKKCFIAAGSVVNKNVPPNSLYAGVPAKLLRKIR